VYFWQRVAASDDGSAAIYRWDTLEETGNVLRHVFEAPTYRDSNLETT
jgi:hypothetical protein